MSPPNGSWRIGELARETGLSVRTLHHYDQLSREDQQRLIDQRRALVPPGPEDS